MTGGNPKLENLRCHQMARENRQRACVCVCVCVCVVCVYVREEVFQNSNVRLVHVGTSSETHYPPWTDHSIAVERALNEPVIKTDTTRYVINEV